MSSSNTTPTRSLRKRRRTDGHVDTQQPTTPASNVGIDVGADSGKTRTPRKRGQKEPVAASTVNNNNNRSNADAPVDYKAVYEQLLAKLKDMSECSICFQSSPNERVVVSCGHSFCKTCIRRHEFDSEKPKCPVCRTEFLPTLSQPKESHIMKEIMSIIMPHTTTATANTDLKKESTTDTAATTSAPGTSNNNNSTTTSATAAAATTAADLWSERWLPDNIIQRTVLRMLDTMLHYHDCPNHHHYPGFEKVFTGPGPTKIRIRFREVNQFACSNLDLMELVERFYNELKRRKFDVVVDDSWTLLVRIPSTMSIQRRDLDLNGIPNYSHTSNNASALNDLSFGYDDEEDDYYDSDSDF